MGLIRSMITVGSHTLLSRILGFIRDMCMLSIMGPGAMFDALSVATKIPSLFRRLFAEGAFNAAFVPIFAKLVSNHQKKEAKDFAENIFMYMAIFLFLFVVIMEIFMPQLISIIASGFRDEPQRFEWAVEYTRIVFPYIFFISLTALLGGVLNSIDYFAAPAATQTIANLVIISVFMTFYAMTPTSGHAAAIGSALSGLVQCVWLYWICTRAGMRLYFAWPTLTPDVRIFFSKLLPAIMGTGVVTLNIFLNILIGSYLPAGGISMLHTADRVNQLPLSIFGVAMGTALLPLLSRQLKSGDLKEAMATQNRALEITMFLTIPACLAILIYADSFIAVLFMRGKFTYEAVMQTAPALAAYACGLPAYVLIKVLSTSFFARQDTTTPVVVASGSIMINIVGSAASVMFLNTTGYAHVGIAAALALSSWVNAIILGILLHRRHMMVFDARLKRRMPRILLASALMAGIIYQVESFFSPLLIHGTSLMQIFSLCMLVILGVVAFMVPAHLFGAVNIGQMINRRPEKEPVYDLKDE